MDKGRLFLKRLLRPFTSKSKKTKTIEQLINALHHAENNHVISLETGNAVECLLQVSSMQVREIMIPKAQMITVYQDDPLETLLPVIQESGHSRFPVLDRASTEVVGILLAKDLLPHCFYRADRSFKLADILRPVFFVPQSKRLDILLREFRINRNHIAIVLDEYSHLTGLITIEDVLEQIVGSIEDEYDTPETKGQIKKIADNTYILKATISIDEFNEYFKENFKKDRLDTIGGIVLKAMKHLPKRGEQVLIRRYHFTVLHSDNRRLYLLEMKLTQ